MNMSPLLFLLLSSATVAPFAEFKVPEAEYGAITGTLLDKCLETANGVTVNIRNCSAAEYEMLDRRLNVEYRSALGRLKTSRERQELRNEQRRWLKTRWDGCRESTASEEGGTLHLIALDGCGNHEMVRRIAWLRAYGAR